jgi:hypothetical protein
MIKESIINSTFSISLASSKLQLPSVDTAVGKSVLLAMINTIKVIGSHDGQVGWWMGLVG